MIDVIERPREKLHLGKDMLTERSKLTFGAMIMKLEIQG